MIVALVAARGGSKGIPKKSLAKVGGKTLIERALASALGSNHINRVIFSSDDSAMLKEASKFDEVTLSHRPQDLSGDLANIYDVARHELVKHKICPPYYVAILQPTTPFRTSSDIDALIDRMLAVDAKSGMAVTEVDYPIEWMFDLDVDGVINRGFLVNSVTRRQDAKQVFKPSGSVYILTHEVLENLEGIMPSPKFRCVTTKIDPLRAINIDTPEQLTIANLFAEAWGW